jgi:DNA repair photolyase
MKKTFKGKAIYQPSGKAAEYSAWACNFYKGCSNGCTYCYLKKGREAKVLGGDKPVLKSCFEHETDALDVFSKELTKNLDALQKHGLFFSFTTDPMLPQTIDLTWDAVGIAIYKKVPVKILTKSTQWVDGWLADIKNFDGGIENPELYAFGFTLTGHDELEPGASTNAERIKAMRKLHDAGFKTWASIEPIIDFESSYRMILESLDCCDLYKIGLESGKKYSKSDLLYFIDFIACELVVPVYFKDSLLKQAGTSRSELPSNCVTRDYNIFRDIQF